MTTTTSNMRTMEDPTAGKWAWNKQPEARRLVEELLIVFVERCPEGAAIGEQILAATGTHITDWVGVILTPDRPETRARLEDAGYIPRTTDFVDADIQYAFWNPTSSTPDILLTDSDRMSVGLLVDSVADFFAANQLSGVDHIQGEPLARARWAQVAQGEGAALWVFERHGYDGYHLKFEIAEHRIAAMHHLERLRARTRLGDQARVHDELDRAIRAAVDELGAEWAASLFTRAEREYFLRNHCAAKSQAARQSSLGLGMANIDHTVYACSASGVGAAMDLFAELGYERREQFGVGDSDSAVVIEQPITGDVVVLVSPLGQKPGISGSWARLFGEGLLASGPAGIAIQGDASSLGGLFSSAVAPSGNASTIASIPVSEERAGRLAGQGLIEPALAETLAGGGLIGPVFSVVSRADGSRRRTAETIAWRAPAAD